MKKMVLITFIISLLTIFLFYLKIKENENYSILKQGKTQINYIENKIIENNDLLKKVEDEQKELLDIDKEKADLLELWKSMLTELQKNI